MKRISLLILTAILGLQGCNSSNKSKSTTKPVLPTKPVITAVHGIQPSEVANYIAEFKLAKENLKFTFEGVESKIFYVDKTKDTIIIKYDKGLVHAGFDFKNNEPTASLTLYEGDTSDLDDFEATRMLTGVDIKISEDDDTSIYSGSVKDQVTGGIYSIRLQLNEHLMGAGDSKLIVNGKKATLAGTLGTSTYIQIQEMINTTSVDTLILSNVSGSDNDAINMHTGRLIRNASLTTLMPKGGEAYSGGVDLFSAGAQRIFETGGKLGVHSWCCTADGKDAGQLSKGDKAHGAQLTYFREMLGTEKGPEFYFYTINAAPANQIHLMSVADMVKYTLTTP